MGDLSLKKSGKPCRTISSVLSAQLVASFCSRHRSHASARNCATPCAKTPPDPASMSLPSDRPQSRRRSRFRTVRRTDSSNLRGDTGTASEQFLEFASRRAANCRPAAPNRRQRHVVPRSVGRPADDSADRGTPHRATSVDRNRPRAACDFNSVANADCTHETRSALVVPSCSVPIICPKANSASRSPGAVCRAST